MIEPSKLEEMIRFAREHKYDQAEGFADAVLTLNLPDEAAQRLNDMADQLAQAAGLSADVARGDSVVDSKANDSPIRLGLIALTAQELSARVLPS
jgi:type IV pilus biogenesis protein CpaD/CtpE